MNPANEAFDAWAQWTSSRPRKGLNPRSQAVYRNIWTNWVAWLLPTPWVQANAQQVSRYLKALTPSAQARHKRHASDSCGASPVTQRRYWRVLREIYAYAVVNNWCPKNPCSNEVEVPSTESMASMILPGWALDATEQGVLKEHANTPITQWRELRNQALLITLLHTAAKTSELARLRVDQLTTVQSDNLHHYVLSFDGAKNAQRRQIAIKDASACAVLRSWLSARQLVSMASSVLFFSAKTAVVEGQRIRSRLSAKSIFLEASNCLQKHVPAGSFKGALAHSGAETLRNSILAAWLLAGMSLEEVMRLAGVSQTRAMLRLVPVEFV